MCTDQPARDVASLVLEPDVRGLDDFPVKRQIRLQQRAELVRRGDERIHALAQQLLPDVGERQDPGEFRREFVDEKIGNSNAPFSACVTISLARQAVNRAVFGENSPLAMPI